MKELILYKIFSTYLNVGQVMDRWTNFTSGFDEIVGYTRLGDVFLKNPKTEEFAILFTMNPELAPLNVHSLEDFKISFLANTEKKKLIIQEEKVAKIRARLGNAEGDEICIPTPFPFMGGDRSIESYKAGNVFTYLELVGGLQGIE